MADFAFSHGLRNLKRAAASAAMLCVALLILAACNRDDVGASGSQPTIAILSPTNGEALVGSTVMIKVAVENFILDPGAIGQMKVNGRGHWHIYLNGDWVAASGDEQYLLEGVPSGAHHIEVTLAQNDHSPVLPVVKDFVIVDVESDVAGASEDSTSYGDEYDLPDMVASNHFVASSPAHAEELYDSPDTITINFDFKLAPESSIALSHGGEAVALGAVQFAPDQLAMAALVLEELDEGIYEVSYRACWPYSNCHSGSFAFVVE